MIYESGPWRSDLLRDSDVLERWLAKHVSERRSVIIEKKVFTGAYVMRRLLQSDKISSALESRNIKLDRFPSLKELRKQDRWNINLHYDFTAGSPTNLTVPRLLELIIHSFIFQQWYDEDTAETKIVFTSDTKRNAFLWLMGLPDFVGIMRLVANDEPQASARRIDPDTGKWVEWRGHGSAPF